MRKLPFKLLGKAFLAAALMTGAANAQQAPVQPATSLTETAQTTDARSLSFKIAKSVNPDGSIEYFDDAVHTVTYFSNGRHDPQAMRKINALLQDRALGTEAPQGMDTALMDILSDIKARLEKSRPGMDVVFHVISGYRDESTNENLRTDPSNPYRSGVAQNSQHSRAKAIDIFVPGISGEELRDTAWVLQKGGVGWYPQFAGSFPHGYIHVDSARVRRWGFP